MIAVVKGYFDGIHIVMSENVALRKGQSVVITYENGNTASDDSPKPLGFYSDGTPYYRKAGMFKGKGWIADDFDAPLDEFKEYME